MRLQATISIFGGGPGSGCNPAVGNCGRPKSAEKPLASYLPGLRPPTKPLQPGESTEEAWRNMKTGEWDKARAEFHQRIVNMMLSGHVRYVGEPRATLLGGGTASGKTTKSRMMMGDDPNVLRIDPDEIKTLIPEYKKLKEEDPENAAARVHEESSFVTKMVLAAAAARRLDFVYDATTAGNGGPMTAKMLASKGYNVTAMFFDVPIELARQRAADRARDSNDPINLGRIVKDHVIQASHYGAADKFMTLKDMPEVNRKEFYDNDVPKSSPAKLVYERDGMGPEKIHDQNRWDQYRAKAAIGAQNNQLAASLDRRWARAIRYSRGRQGIGAAV